VAATEINVRVDLPLIRALLARADVEGVSLNVVCRRLLAEGLERKREERRRSDYPSFNRPRALWRVIISRSTTTRRDANDAKDDRNVRRPRAR
jgi:hypothetical protein